MEELLAGESSSIEYKQEVPSNSEKYIKTIIAFANGNGGLLVFGIEDETCKVVGIPQEEVFLTADRVTNTITDTCQPMVDFEIKYKTVEEKTIIIVKVFPGARRPYYLKNKGITDGTYIRVSGTTRKADDFVVKELSFQGENKYYDQTIAVGYEVTKDQIDSLCSTMYDYAIKQCATPAEKAAVKRVEEKHLIAWGLLVQREDKLLPTNGFLLLTSNPFLEASIQCAVFKGVDRSVFIDRKEYSGSLFDQIDEAYQFVLRNIRMGANINGLYRKDIYELPIDSIREVIANAISHRSYLDPAKVQVAIYDDRLEITSPGMLIGGVTIEDLKSGCSRPRNRGIVSALTYMKIIEQWGSGIPKMISACRKAGLPEPELKEMGGSFRVNMFRPGEISSLATTQGTTQATQGATQATQATTQAPLSEAERVLLKEISKHPSISQKQIADELGWSVDRAKYYFKKLKRKGLIKRVGSSQTGHWELLVEEQEDGPWQK